MENKFFKILLITLCFTLLACSNKHKVHRKIHVYKSHVSNQNDDFFVYWYIITFNDNDGRTNYYSTYSKAPISDFTSSSWSYSSTPPVSTTQAGVEELTDVEVAMSDLPEDLQTEIADNETEVSESQSETTDEASDESGDSESGSSDSGSSDSGGDSGGGDGGGGE